MLVERSTRYRRCQEGMTLIELMISIVLGLLILSAATAMTVKSLAMNTDTLASARLNQELDSIIHVMVNEIRRAGFTGNAFFPADNEDLYIESASCVLYAYDANENGGYEDDEKFGFKLVNSEVQMRTGCTAGASCAIDCDTGDWAALNDTATTSVTSLTFTSVGSKCISLTDPGNVVSESNENNYWITTTADTRAFPCVAPSAADLTTYVMDSSKDYETGTFVAPASGDRLIEARQVNVVVQGNLTGDSTMVKNQQVSINVRNDHIRIVP